MLEKILSEKQIKKYNDWKESFKPLPYLGATGGHFGLKIIFTSVEDVIIGYNWKGDEIDLTEW